MFKKKENPFVEILQFGWGKFKSIYPSYSTGYYDSTINKAIRCRNPQFGYIEYRCMSCGQGVHRSGFSCKTKFCIHCARKSSNDFIEEIMGKLHPGIVYRHLILTIPEQLRKIFYKNRITGDLYDQFIRIGRDYIEDVFRHVTGIKNLKIGCVIVLHTAGRPGTYNPHLHIIVMAGGIDPATGRWVDLPYFKYENLLPKKWQYHLLKMIKSFDSSPENHSLVKKLWRIYKKGFVNNFKKGGVPKEIRHLVKYLAKYISKPSISIASISSYDFEKDEVIYRYKDHRTNKKVTTFCDVMNFIGRLTQQILPKGFHRIRYFGLQHPSSFQKNVKEINDGLAKSGKKLHSDDSFIAFAVGNWGWINDPRKCFNCGDFLEVWKIWSKKYGVIWEFRGHLIKTGVSPPILDPITLGNFINVGKNFSLPEVQLSFLC